MHLLENTSFDLWPWDQGHMNCCPVPSTSCELGTLKVISCYVKQFRRRCIYKKIHYLSFDLGVKVTRNIAQYPLHNVIYAYAKFEVAKSNGLREAKITRIVTDGRTDGRRTDFGTKLICLIFLTKKWV